MNVIEGRLDRRIEELTKLQLEIIKRSVNSGTIGENKKLRDLERSADVLKELIQIRNGVKF